MKGKTLKNASNTYTQALARTIADHPADNRGDVIDFATGQCSDRRDLASRTMQWAGEKVKTYLPKRGGR